MKDPQLFTKHAELVQFIGDKLTNKKLHGFYDRALRAVKKPVKPQDLASLKGKIDAIITDLNKRTGKHFSVRCEPTRQAITARLAERTASLRMSMALAKFSSLSKRSS